MKSNYYYLWKKSYLIARNQSIYYPYKDPFTLFYWCIPHFKRTRFVMHIFFRNLTYPKLSHLNIYSRKQHLSSITPPLQSCQSKQFFSKGRLLLFCNFHKKYIAHWRTMLHLFARFWGEGEREFYMVSTIVMINQAE